MDKKEQETKDFMQELQNESEAIRQSVVIGRLIQDAVDRESENAQKDKDRLTKIVKIMAWILALSIFINVAIVGAFLWYESQWEYETTTTTTTTQTVDGSDAEINNIEGDMYKDNSSNQKNS